MNAYLILILNWNGSYTRKGYQWRTNIVSLYSWHINRNIYFYRWRWFFIHLKKTFYATLDLFYAEKKSFSSTEANMVQYLRSKSPNVRYLVKFTWWTVKIFKRKNNRVLIYPYIAKVKRNFNVTKLTIKRLNLANFLSNLSLQEPSHIWRIMFTFLKAWLNKY